MILKIKKGNNFNNKEYPAFGTILSGDKLFNKYYTDQCYLRLGENTITFVDRADFTHSISFKVAKSKLNSHVPLTLNDLKKVVEMPASWGYLNKYDDEDRINACRALTCLIYNHFIGKDIDIPGIK